VEVADESLEVCVTRIEERDISQWKTLDSIAKGIDRIERKLDQPLPCDRNQLRLDNLEKSVQENHEKRLKTIEDHKSYSKGKLAA